MLSGVTKIGQYAFYCCTYLRDVYYLSTISDWNKIEITNTNDVLKEATIHCIDGTINEKVPTLNHNQDLSQVQHLHQAQPQLSLSLLQPLLPQLRLNLF